MVMRDSCRGFHPAIPLARADEVARRGNDHRVKGYQSGDFH
jgi:hypothetical protein